MGFKTVFAWVVRCFKCDTLSKKKIAMPLQFPPGHIYLLGSPGTYTSQHLAFLLGWCQDATLWAQGGRPNVVKRLEKDISTYFHQGRFSQIPSLREYFHTLSRDYPHQILQKNNISLSPWFCGYEWWHAHSLSKLSVSQLSPRPPRICWLITKRNFWNLRYYFACLIFKQEILSCLSYF